METTAAALFTVTLHRRAGIAFALETSFVSCLTFPFTNTRRRRFCGATDVPRPVSTSSLYCVATLQASCHAQCLKPSSSEDRPAHLEQRLANVLDHHSRQHALLTWVAMHLHRKDHRKFRGHERTLTDSLGALFKLHGTAESVAWPAVCEQVGHTSGCKRMRSSQLPGVRVTVESPCVTIGFLAPFQQSICRTRHPG
jgi:hypothetical protein|eukprot:7380107-Prymnesium_polylepis.2